jgi:hypothetical protein
MQHLPFPAQALAASAVRDAGSGRGSHRSDRAIDRAIDRGGPELIQARAALYRRCTTASRIVIHPVPFVLRQAISSE